MDLNDSHETENPPGVGTAQARGSGHGVPHESLSTGSPTRHRYSYSLLLRASETFAPLCQHPPTSASDFPHKVLSFPLSWCACPQLAFQQLSGDHQRLTRTVQMGPHHRKQQQQYSRSLSVGSFWRSHISPPRVKPPPGPWRPSPNTWPSKPGQDQPGNAETSPPSVQHHHNPEMPL